MTISIMVFVVAAMLSYNVFPLTAMMIIILAGLDDIPIMTIAFDSTYLSPTPVRGEMHRVLTVSTVLGFLATIESFLGFFLGRTGLHLTLPPAPRLEPPIKNGPMPSQGGTNRSDRISGILQPAGQRNHCRPY